jgi:hypothetical protein
MRSDDTSTAGTVPVFEISTSRQFLPWLAEQQLALALSTYQIGKLYFLGLKPDRTLSVFERSFKRCMGLCASPQGLWLSSNQRAAFGNSANADSDFAYVELTFSVF